MMAVAEAPEAAVAAEIAPRLYARRVTRTVIVVTSRTSIADRQANARPYQKSADGLYCANDRHVVSSEDAFNKKLREIMISSLEILFKYLLYEKMPYHSCLTTWVGF